MSRISAFLVLMVMSTVTAETAWGQQLTDTGAKTSGDWEDASIWTGGAAPNSSNAVYIGSTRPSGAAATATVSLTADESAAEVNVGEGSGTNGTLDLGGHMLKAGNITFGEFGSWNFNEGGGSLTAGLATFVGGGPFNLGANDVVNQLYLGPGASVQTTATGNVTGLVNVTADGNPDIPTLTLGADLKLTGDLDMSAGGTLNAQGHSLTADSMSITLGSRVENLGQLTVNNLDLGGSSSVTLHGGNFVGNSITVEGSAPLIVDVPNQPGSVGLVLNGTAAGNPIDPSLYLNLSPNSPMILDFSGLGVGFAWRDPREDGFNWIPTLYGMIAQGEIAIEMPKEDSYSLYDQNGYTYIGVTGAAVPEPSSLVLLGLGTLGVVFAMRKRGRSRGRDEAGSHRP